ncbi:MAG TPA: DUF547 domain-containing protein [Vicinamibacterales bacterium]|nr:DUF547 domain-containing protein [Vicinamibacterales bacterium]
MSVDRVLLGLIFVAAVASASPAQLVPSTVHPLHQPFDRLLDTYVRDGFVYYNALRIERAALDRYVASLNSPAATALAKGPADEQKAFWINAYNALVLRTVVDRFPIRGRAGEYPASSIRQIPGAFEKAGHRVAGRLVSLDAIEKEILAPFGDARVFLALGRGAYGGGRLRSEAFDGPIIEKLLAAVAAESVSRATLVRIDPPSNRVSLSPIFSWREAAFVESFAHKADPLFAQRSPLERAVLALIMPHLSGPEAQFLPQNTFKMEFHEFDWRLNDLSSRPR